MTVRDGSPGGFDPSRGTVSGDAYASIANQRYGTGANPLIVPVGAENLALDFQFSVRAWSRHGVLHPGAGRRLYAVGVVTETPVATTPVPGPLKGISRNQRPSSARTHVNQKLLIFVEKTSRALTPLLGV